MDIRSILTFLRFFSMKKYSSLKRANFSAAIFGKFFIGDLAFTILPLAIIIFLNLALGKPAIDIPYYPEWSFASIVIIGMAMTRMLELKMLYQQDKSYRIFTLSKICILLLIGASLSLALCQLKPYGVDINLKFLVLLQFSMFFMGIFLLLVAHIGKEKHISDQRYLPPNITISKYYDFIEESMSDLGNEITYLNNALSRHERFDFLDDEHKDDFNIVVKNKEKRISNTFQHISNSFESLCSEFEAFKCKINDTQPGA